MNRSKIIYHVNKDKRTIVCMITGCRYLAIDRILKYTPTLDLDPCYLESRFEMRDSYTGVAKCSPEDEWDEEYGKQLALLKAKQKRGHAINIRINRFVDNIKAETETLVKYGIHEIPKEI